MINKKSKKHFSRKVTKRKQSGGSDRPLENAPQTKTMKKLSITEKLFGLGKHSYNEKSLSKKTYAELEAMLERRKKLNTLGEATIGKRIATGAIVGAVAAIPFGIGSIVPVITGAKRGLERSTNIYHKTAQGLNKTAEGVQSFFRNGDFTTGNKKTIGETEKYSLPSKAIAGTVAISSLPLTSLYSGYGSFGKRVSRTLRGERKNTSYKSDKTKAVEKELERRRLAAGSEPAAESDFV